ncbi:MAG: catechol 2,3-dioxygenase-like lactoylglutathione lyase family enzyme [Rhodothermales bacterium]|jgi:catechol 2,3-dioxygenase-like lactoylglutathione lyase family enzyme
MPIAHLTFACRDIEATARFLEAVMRWPRAAIPQNAEGGVVWLEIADGQELHIIRVDDFEPSAFEREYGRHLAIAVSTDEMAAIKERLTERQTDIIPPIRPTPHERFFFREPNGYVIEVINADQFVPSG